MCCDTLLYCVFTEKTYTFTVYTVNDADESIRESEQSQPVSCKTRADGK